MRVRNAALGAALGAVLVFVAAIAYDTSSSGQLRFRAIGIAALVVAVVGAFIGAEDWS